MRVHRIISTKDASLSQEKRIARRVNGNTVVNSGSTRFSKGDVKCPKFLVECKTSITEKQSVSIKSEWIKKIKEEAFAMNRPYWALVFNFGETGVPKDYVIIDMNLFKVLQIMMEEDE